MTKERARLILEASKLEGRERAKALNDLNVKTFGNKGRYWNGAGCCTEIDDIKGQCNPRLSHNYCDSEDFGCIDCTNTLKEIAGELDPVGYNPDFDIKHFMAIEVQIGIAMIAAYFTICLV